LVFDFFLFIRLHSFLIFPSPGLMHIGVVKALYTIGMLPDIISGSSLGAIVAAFVCVRSDEELPKVKVKLFCPFY